MNLTYPDEIINKILCGDCIELMGCIPDNSIDLTISSPPYNIGLEYDVNPDNIGRNEYRKWFKDVAEEIYRITKIGGRLCFNLGVRVNTFNGIDESIDSMNIHNDFKNAEWVSREIITWVKTREEGNPQSFCGSNTSWGSWISASNPVCRSYSEYIFVYHKLNPKKEPVGESDITKEEFMDYSRNVWYFPAETKRRGHPAPFPEELPYRCIRFYSYIDDVIFDPFCGTGTVCKVAKDLNRNYIGIDISSKYVNMSKQRLSQTKLDGLK